MQLLRTLQYAHWNEAVLSQGVAVPLLSPYTVSFQTLPDHWRLVERIGRSADRPQENLLPSGDFEDRLEIGRRWIHSQHVVEGVKADAALVNRRHGGQYALQLVATPMPGMEPPLVIPRPPVTVTSPAIPVRAGQVLYISGWICVVNPVAGSLDGVTVHDTVGGLFSALRFNERAGWQRFQMLRDVREDTDYRLTINLNGIGEVLLDDVKVIPHLGRSIQTASEIRPVFSQPPPQRRFWNPLQSFRPREAAQPLDTATQSRRWSAS